MLKLSIVTVNYNQCNLLKLTLESCYRTINKCQFELFVVDNNSQDGSVALIKSQFPKVRLIVNDANRGFASAANQAIRDSSSEYILLLNNDIELLAGAVDAMLKLIDKNPKTAICAPQLVNPNGSRQRTGGLFELWYQLKPTDKPHKVRWVPAACMLVRKRAIDEVGAMDEHYFFYNEDMDWCKRMREAGWEIYFVPKAKVIHVGGASTKGWDPELAQKAYSGSIYYCQKHYGRLGLSIYTPLVVCELALRAFFWSLRLLFVKDRCVEARSRIKTYCKIIRTSLFLPSSGAI